MQREEKWDDERNKKSSLWPVESPAELKHLTPAEEKKAKAISSVTASEKEPQNQRPTLDDQAEKNPPPLDKEEENERGFRLWTLLGGETKPMRVAEAPWERSSLKKNNQKLSPHKKRRNPRAPVRLTFPAEKTHQTNQVCLEWQVPQSGSIRRETWSTHIKKRQKYSVLVSEG